MKVETIIMIYFIIMALSYGFVAYSVVYGGWCIYTYFNNKRYTSVYYCVKRGDTLWDLSELVYGNHKRVKKIAKWNNIKDPNNILIGQELQFKLTKKELERFEER